MATLYRVKDGPRGDRTDQGVETSTTRLAKKLSGYDCRFLGDEPPEFNIGKSSDYFARIVVEVSADDELNAKFSRPGFYVVTDLHSSRAGFLYQNSN